jgi:prepilin-type N-terminal cleavage/methylation domain-containing protein
MTPIQRYGNTRQRGFTLVELALVVGIVALLLGGLMVPLSRSLDQKAVATTQARLEAAQQALVGFALLNESLPCPDTGNTGLAGNNAPPATGCAGSTDTTGATLSPPAPTSAAGPPVLAGASWGHLPWATLGVDGVDGWGNRLDYAVYTPLVDSGTLTSALLNASNLVVMCTKTTITPTGGGVIPGCLTSAAIPAVTPSSKTSFVVFSHGKNGLGAMRPSGTTNTAPATVDEVQNQPATESTADDRRTFIFRYQTDATSSAGEFDDLMVWMPSNLLAAKLLAAGKWTP